MKRSLNKLQLTLLSALPLVVFFSYYPVIHLGENSSTNFELSLPLVWLLVFGSSSLLSIKRIYTVCGIKKILLLCLMPLYITISILWSQNALRGILTAGIAWLLAISVLSIYSLKLNKKRVRKLLDLHIIGGVFSSIICLTQCFLDVFGIDQRHTLLCQGCTYSVFGFPHANGLAIEPQFMGNLLIIPAILSLLKTYNTISARKSNGSILKTTLLTILINMSLFICFSRGAIFSLVFGVILLFIYSAIKKRNTITFVFPAIIAVSFGLGLLTQGLLAAISPTNEGFVVGVQRSVSQLSLGKINFNKNESEETIVEPTAPKSEDEAVFDGYIEESTTIRLDLNKAAIELWKSNPITAIFGIGIGSTGSALAGPDGYQKEIIQNEPLAILLELGCVGVVILIIYSVLLLKQLRFLPGYFWAIIFAFIISLMFFSGLPNALHIYLITPLVFIFGHKRLYGKID